MSQFHNPYHFVPIAEGTPPGSIPLSEIAGAAHLSHDRYTPDTHSGRFVCRITVETPLLVGNEQRDRPHLPKLLLPFSINNGETPVLPASGLRGLFSAITEAATGSALRILEDTPLSHRMAMGNESLSAMGLLVETTEGTRLQPLTVPTLLARDPVLPEEWRTMFPEGSAQPLLKAYVDGYRKTGQAIEASPGSFLQNNNPDSASSTSSAFWYARLGPSPSIRGCRVECGQPRVDSRKRMFLLGQNISGDPISETEWQELDPGQQDTYCRGILRVLGTSNRPDMPGTKKHEIFIPYPPGSENLPHFDCTAALDQFHILADQRTAENPAFPFSVEGATRNADPNSLGDKLRLRAGDIIFFAPTSDGTCVAEISVSSIWRAGNGTVHQYFSRLSPDLLPFSPGRRHLTLAEQLFGFVEEQPAGHQNLPAGRALASRLRFTDAHLHTAPQEGPWIPVRELLNDQQRQAMDRLGWQDYPLQNLASPKPPSPALYFKSSNGSGRYIPKRSLQPGNDDSPQPQGRKFYLRRPDAAAVCGTNVFVHPDRLDDQDQLNSIALQHQAAERLIRPESVFFFIVEFDNLTALEVSTLAWALSPDGDTFRHQAGHGKPFGLGQIRVEPLGLLLVHRLQRYAADTLTSRRYHRVHAAQMEDWPQALRPAPSGETLPIEQTLPDLRADFETWAKDNGLAPMLGALRTLGNPASVRHPVHYPQQGGRDGADMERESFKWFVANDDTRNHRRPGQFLAPLAAPGGSLSALPSFYREQSETNPPLLAAQPRHAPTAAAGTPQKGETYSFVANHQKDGRILWRLTLGDETYDGYLAIQKAERSRYRNLYPEGACATLEVQNVAKPLQLKMPAKD